MLKHIHTQYKFFKKKKKPQACFSLVQNERHVAARFQVQTFFWFMKQNLWGSEQNLEGSLLFARLCLQTQEKTFLLWNFFWVRTDWPEGTGNKTGRANSGWYGHEVNRRDGFGLSGFVMVSAGMRTGWMWLKGWTFLAEPLWFEKDLSSKSTGPFGLETFQWL